MIVVVLGTIVALWLVYALRTATFPFICGLVLAYFLLPLISWVERRLPGQGRWPQVKRVSLILLIFVVVLGLVGGLLFYVILAVVDSLSVLIGNAPQYFSGGINTLREWAEGLRQWFPPEMQEQIDSFILDAGVAVGSAIRDAVLRAVSVIPTTSSLVFGFLCLPIFLFYILKDSEKLRAGFYSGLSPRVAEHTKNIISIVEGIFGRFIRAVLMLGLLVACLCLVGLLIVGIDPGLALALAVFAGLTDLIPVLGPWIGGVVGVIVVLAIAPEKAIWAALVYLLVQGLENAFLRPRIQGAYLRIHPAITLVLLVLGAYVAGFWGLILAVPLAATIVEIYKYVHQNIEVGQTQQVAEQ
jgi:predicted PurR-regulated permease PerM